MTGNLRNLDVYGVLNNNNVGGNRRKTAQILREHDSGHPVFGVYPIHCGVDTRKRSPFKATG